MGHQSAELIEAHLTARTVSFSGLFGVVEHNVILKTALVSEALFAKGALEGRFAGVSPQVSDSFGSGLSGVPAVRQLAVVELTCKQVMRP